MYLFTNLFYTNLRTRTGLHLHLWIDAVLRCFVLFRAGALGIINA